MRNGAGEAARQGLRAFLSTVKRIFPEQLLRIRELVPTARDITSLVFKTYQHEMSRIQIIATVSVFQT